jgi:hypothetical protein
VRDVAVAAAGEARTQAAQLASEARTRADTIARQQKAQAADALGQVAGAVLQAAHRLDEGGNKTIARSALTFAEKIDRAGRYLRERELADMLEDVEEAARRHPVAFASATFAAGVVAARFLKSSQRRTSTAGPLYDSDLAYAAPEA